jgi:putative redox protein
MKPPVNLRITWAGEKRFDGGRPGRPTQRIDGDGTTAPSPVDTLINSFAACSAVDVVDILAKRRTPVASMYIDAHAERADAVPARVVSVRLDFHIDGEGIDRANAERAIELAVAKYCSVGASLDPAISVAFSLTLNGEAGAVTPLPKTLPI